MSSTAPASGPIQPGLTPGSAIPAPPGDGDLPVRHYGDPAGEYRSATTGAAILDRSRRGQLLLTGRQPGRMMAGVATGTIPALPEEGEAGRAPMSLVLTPKGRPLAELRIMRVEGGESGALLLDLPRLAVEPLLEHFRRSMPPLFARPRDRSAERGCLTLVGPDAAQVLAHALEVDTRRLAGLREGDELVLPSGARRAAEGPDEAGPDPGIRIIGQGDLAPPALDVLGPREVLQRIWDRAVAAGAEPAGQAVWDTLRVEHGRPAFGVDVDDTVLPPEAGLEHRFIDSAKGCYTGQEVIVRIRDRGKVNRHLRGLHLGGQPAPPAGAPLVAEGGERVVGEVRSVVQSPRFQEGIALAYVRREVEPGTRVRVGGPDGPAATVRALSDGGWLGVDDPSSSEPSPP